MAQIARQQAPAAPGPGSTGADLSMASPLPAEHVADYIADLSRELAELAHGARLDFVAHLLELVEMEARAGAAAPAAKRKR